MCMYVCMCVCTCVCLRRRSMASFLFTPRTNERLKPYVLVNRPSELAEGKMAQFVYLTDGSMDSCASIEGSPRKTQHGGARIHSAAGRRLYRKEPRWMVGWLVHCYWTVFSLCH
ncbi:hypothetical protein LX32DRAFT_150377 [Colletotrichum zoysiae]|uniref:Uncharacterized protein n=1 Tax=Colletotrichum zoysiae TaxID=1216348 RepID=A0AAD9H7Q9_9PEZI|nr:hypothetical protein LX32DRAFT_150377 [Colletotrichum zoysiae]